MDRGPRPERSDLPVPPARRIDRGLIGLAALGAAVLVAVIAAIALTGGERTLETYGPSMRPTMAGRSAVDVDFGAFDDRIPRLGEIVVANPPQGYDSCGVQREFRSSCPEPEELFSTDLFVKRVVGVPGDSIAFTPNGRVIRNGVRQEEPFIRACKRRNCGLPVAIDLNEGQFFLAGDNRPVSLDSRVFGPVSEEAVAGLVHLGD